MRLRILGAAALAALIVVAVAPAAPALAQTSPAAQAKKDAAERDAQARARARVTVQKRSFLDAGTEVLPGQRKFKDYAFPPGYSPTSSIDYTSGNVRAADRALIRPATISGPGGPAPAFRRERLDLADDRGPHLGCAHDLGALRRSSAVRSPWPASRRSPDR
jgi:hypothetical protein